MRIAVLSLTFIAIAFSSSAFAAERAGAATGGSSVKIVQNYIAVLDLDVVGKVDKDVVVPLSDSIRSEIVQCPANKYEVVDRNYQEKTFKEQGFQQLGCTKRGCAVEAGELLGAGKIVVGTLSMIGDSYNLSLSLINVETGKIEKSVVDTCPCRENELPQFSKRQAALLICPPAPPRPKIASGIHLVAGQCSLTPQNQVFNKVTGAIDGQTVKIDYENVLHLGVEKWTKADVRSQDIQKLEGTAFSAILTYPFSFSPYFLVYGGGGGRFEKIDVTLKTGSSSTELNSGAAFGNNAAVAVAGARLGFAFRNGWSFGADASYSATFGAKHTDYSGTMLGVFIGF